MTDVHVVVPAGIDDPARPSGGNTYDRRICLELAAGGWSVHEHQVPGPWPHPDDDSYAALAAVLRRIPDDAVVLLDGLVASAAPEALLSHDGRLRLVVLVHMPLGHDHDLASGSTGPRRARERDALSAAAAVVTTSEWSRRRLLRLYPSLGDRVRVAEPAVDIAPLVTGTADGGSLLCVAAVTAGKGHDILIDALAMAQDLPWTCVCVGALDLAPAHVHRLRQQAVDQGLGGRVKFAGTLTGSDLDNAYEAADVLILASRSETYGMVVTEALARGLPVIASDVGGVSEALGHAGALGRPGLLLPPADAGALGSAVRAWLTDAELRRRLRVAARRRRQSLAGWATPTAAVTEVLVGASR